MSVDNETIRTVVIGMADGNPGALTVLAQIAKRPDRELLIAELVRKQLLAPAIWRLYQDEHGGNLEQMCVALYTDAKGVFE